MRSKLHIFILLIVLAAGFLSVSPPGASALNTLEWYVDNYSKAYPAYQNYELPAVQSYQKNYDGSIAQSIVGRAMWYMHYGSMVYGNLGYSKNGTIDCSNFVYLIYREFGYSLTSYASRYGTVGTKVPGVYSTLQPGSTSKYMLVGVENLKPGDIFTYWSTNASGARYISHVAIYTGMIDGKPWIIQTISGRPTAIGMTCSFTYWYGQHFIEARRVLPDSAFVPGSQGSLPAPVIPASYILPPQTAVIMPADLPGGFGLPASEPTGGGTNPGSDPTQPTDPGSDPGGSTPPTDPTDPGTTDPGTTDPGTTPPTDPPVDPSNPYVKSYLEAYPAYAQQELPAAASFRFQYQGSLAQAIVGRALWYMQHGYMVAGSGSYASSGVMFNSNFIYLCFRDFGITLSPNLGSYSTTGIKVAGVSSALQTGSSTKYALSGIENLRPGDIFLFWDKNASGQKYVSHVALYAGSINGQPWIIHTIQGRPTAIGMTDSFTYWYGQHFMEARRVLPDSAFVPNTQTALPAPVIPASYMLPPQHPIIMPSDLPSGF